jgi:hypothetical protein
MPRLAPATIGENLHGGAAGGVQCLIALHIWYGAHRCNVAVSRERPSNQNVGFRRLVVGGKHFPGHAEEPESKP